MFFDWDNDGTIIFSIYVPFELKQSEMPKELRESDKLKSSRSIAKNEIAENFLY